jgi:anti-sigma B factor antagonist
MEQNLEIEQRKKGDVVILDLRGFLTIGVGETLFKDAIQNLTAQKQTKVVANLQAVEFMDSSGVGALVKGYTTLTKTSGHLKLLHPSRQIRQSLKITGLLGIFEVFDDEAAAVASF